MAANISFKCKVRRSMYSSMEATPEPNEGCWRCALMFVGLGICVILGLIGKLSLVTTYNDMINPSSLNRQVGFKKARIKYILNQSNQAQESSVSGIMINHASHILHASEANHNS